MKKKDIVCMRSVGQSVYQTTKTTTTTTQKTLFIAPQQIVKLNKRGTSFAGQSDQK